MDRKKRIKKILFDNFSLAKIDVFDVSMKHKGHNNFDGLGQTHFSINLKINSSKRINRLEIHRKINNLLKNEFLNGLHSLEIKIEI